VPDAPIVTLETTVGDLVLELDPTAAPLTVENFLFYVKSGYYAGVVWHRVIPRFVAQTGGYTLDGKRKAPLRPPLRFERSPLKHTDGALGMARAQEYNSATSEFYLCDGAQRDLDGEYCVFGRLADGRETLQRILKSPTRPDDWPLEPPIVLRAYEGKPDPANPAPRHQPPAKLAPSADADAVRQAAKKLRGRAAIFRSRKPLTAMGDVEGAIAAAEKSGKREDLERAERLLAEKEKRG
jgi:peptidyl-prolyl cis-trans isomerase A (cyclophilin A)